VVTLLVVDEDVRRYASLERVLGARDGFDPEEHGMPSPPGFDGDDDE
jgi:hypothetical protein